VNVSFTNQDGDITTDPLAVLQNTDADASDVDFRSIVDSDSDGILDESDIDDDNDGILDVDEGMFDQIVGGDFSDEDQWTFADTTQAGVFDINTSDQLRITEEGPGDLFNGNVAVASNSVINLIQGETYTLTFDAQATGTANVDPGTIQWVLLSGTDSVNDTVVDNISPTYATTGTSADVTLTTSLDSYQVEYTHTLATGAYGFGLTWDVEAGGSSGEDIIIDNVSLVGAADTDADGIVNRLDLDSDNDGISDLVESGSDASEVDTNNDGILDGTTDIDSDPTVMIRVATQRQMAKHRLIQTQTVFQTL